MQNRIYILHEYGEKSHYEALQKLLEEYNIKLEFFEFACIKGIIKELLHRNWRKAKKELYNCQFLLNLFFTERKKIILGIAPFDYRLIILQKLLAKHKVYYHTSWPYWDETFYPKKRFVNAYVKKQWKDFLNDKVEAIFCVTQNTKNNIAHYLEKDKEIFVVYHAYDEKIFFDQNLKKEIDFLYVGRLVKEKGIEELLDIFAKKEETLLIVGEGVLEEKVRRYAKKYDNISYLPKQTKKELAKFYNKSRFFLLNSQKTVFWEELFGMVLIESMACGSIPMATNHTGPQEILANGVYGILYNEGELETLLGSVEIQKKKFFIMKRAKEFTSENIKKRWRRILDE